MSAVTIVTIAMVGIFSYMQFITFAVNFSISISLFIFIVFSAIKDKMLA